MRIVRTALGLAGLAIAVSVSHAGELGDLLRAAMTHPQVMAAQVSEAAAQLQTSAARARYYGSVNMTANWHRYEGERVVGYYAPTTTPLPLLSRHIAQVGASYALPIDLAGVVDANIRRSQEDAAVGALAVRQQVLLKLHQTTAAITTLRGLAGQREALTAARRRIEATRQRTLKEVELGRSPGVEARYVDSELSRIAADEAALAGSLTQAQAELAEATGHAGIMPGNDQITIPAWEEPVQLLPVEMADAAYRSATLQSEETRRTLLPSLALDTGYFRSFAGGDHRTTWVVGVTLNVPFSPSQTRQAQAQVLKAEATRLQRDASESEVKRQLAVLRASYDAAKAEAHAMETEVAYREQVSAVEHEMQRLGNQTLENSFRHERDLLDARYRLSRAKARATIAWSAAQTLAGAPVDTYIDRLDPK